MPKFRIKGVATIRARSMLFCNGEVLGGKVAVGQRVVAPVGLPPIAAIEFALLSEPPRHEEPALGFRFVSEDERVNLLRLLPVGTDRKSTRLNSSHMSISYAVFCLKKKK